MNKKVLAIMASLALSGAANAQWDSIVGDTKEIDGFDHYWVSTRRGDTMYLVDTRTGEVGGTLSVSRFSPAIAPHMDAGRIYSYGSYYSRRNYGDLTNVMLIYDAATASPIGEVELPELPAGIGHPGMMGLMNDKFVGIWNISPATTVSVIDIETETLAGVVPMPSCSGIYPEGQGWISVCGDGTALYTELNDSGEVSRRIQSRPFFEVAADPVYDYSVPAVDGWMFMSFDGLLRKVSLNTETLSLDVSEPYDINPENDGIADVNNVMPPKDDHWRIGGYQPFAYHDSEALLVTLMHEGGGQETFEKSGTEVWVYNMETGNRGFRLSLEEGVSARGILLTPGENPMMVLNTNEGLQIREPRTGRLLHTLEDAAGTMQSLYEELR